jgi:predicted membrane-bound dolichyl-phosphate-mannose-protein mannosyltransferase
MDEYYYIPDSWSFLKYGYEVKWTNDTKDETLVNKFITNFGEAPYSMDYAASHPPLGKMLTAIGMFFFGGNDPLGWRIAAIVAGTAVVLFTMILAHRLFKRKSITLLSGAFMMIDPMAIAMSRIVHLDIFLTVFVLLGFIFTERYYRLRSTKYLVLLSVAFGLASAVKWSGLYFFAVVGICLAIIAINNRTFVKDIPRFILAVASFVVSYAITWYSWIINFSMPKTGNVFNSFVELFNKHVSMLSTHGKLSYEHPYSSKASEWFFASHPTLLTRELTDGDKMVAAVVATPNLILWLGSMVGLLFIIVVMFYNRSILRRFWIPVAAVVGGWVPWLLVGDRTIFQFYTVVFQPYLYMILAYLVVLILVKQKRRKLSLYRLIVLIIMFSAVVLSFRMYNSSVGLETQSENSGYSISTQWWHLMADLGLYDLNQGPEDSVLRK